MTTCCIETRGNEARRSSWWVVAAFGVLVVLCGSACGGAKPIHYYQPDVITDRLASDQQEASSNLILAIEDFSAGSAYDEQRIVYRSNDYRFDYYHYHRWASTPGLLVSDVLREIYRDTGAFRAVLGGYDTRADVVLSGRVVAFEEVDVSNKKWLGHIVLNLRLRDARTGELIWNEMLRRKVPVEEHSPEGLAAALSQGLTDIGVSTADDMVRVGTQSIRQRSEDANSSILPGTEKKRGSSENSESEEGR